MSEQNTSHTHHTREVHVERGGTGATGILSFLVGGLVVAVGILAFVFWGGGAPDTAGGGNGAVALEENGEGTVGGGGSGAGTTGETGSTGSESDTGAASGGDAAAAGGTDN